MPKAESARAKVKRDEAIIHDRARGFGWAQIGARHSVSARMAQLVWRQHLESVQPVQAIDPMDAMAEALIQIDAVIGDLGQLAEESKHDAVRLGAIRTRLVALERRTVLLQACGALPQFRRWSQQIDAQRLSDIVLSTLEAEGASESLMDALEAALAADLQRSGYLAAA